MNKVQQLAEMGQSIWYDNIERGMLEDGEFAGMIARGEIRGVTSNPSIFMNAIAKTTEYDDDLRPLAATGRSPEEIFWELAIEDIRNAADLFRPLFDATHGGDGFVSLEVGPGQANDTEATIAETQRLWSLTDRPNLMIKIPATLAGIPAITTATAHGLNINITLIFARERYAAVMDAFLSGLEQSVAAGLPIDHIASVASFFVSRVDTNVDKRLEAIIGAGGPQAAEARSLLGKAAIANAKLAYADFQRVFSSDRFAALKAKGAQVQRPLWASTSTKNPAYRDVIYVEDLIGPDTVNTVPQKTLTDLLDHAVLAQTLTTGVDEAQTVIDRLAALGIDMADVTHELEIEGVQAFTDAFHTLLASIEKKLAVVAA